MSTTDVVRASFDAYRAQDRTHAEQLISEDFVFTSPQDDHIDKATYMERCFPTADRFERQEILELVSSGDDGVFLLYEYELKNGDKYRNMEFITVRAGQLIETQVFFGGRVADPGAVADRTLHSARSVSHEMLEAARQELEYPADETGEG
jgi:ketosteroid isomerase-like protein